MNLHPEERRIIVKAEGKMASENKSEVRTDVAIVVEADR